MPRSPNTHLYLVVYFTKHIFYKRHAHTHAHTCIHLANKDELPLDNRVIGTLVNSFFEYSYAPTNVGSNNAQNTIFKKKLILDLEFFLSETSDPDPTKNGSGSRQTGNV